MEDRCWSHSTDEGTFEIKPKVVDGDEVFELTFRGDILGTYLHPGSAARSICDGDHDEAIGPASQLGVPDDPNHWNNTI